MPPVIPADAVRFAMLTEMPVRAIRYAPNQRASAATIEAAQGTGVPQRAD
jgi:hypothetical protein